MSGESQPLSNAEKQQRHRVGTTHRLKAIESKLDGLSALTASLVDVVEREVATSALIRKSIIQENSDA